MSAKDIFHEAVKHGLVKDGWTIAADPLELEWEGITVKMNKIELYRASIQALL
jgi:hypothetical protein